MTTIANPLKRTVNTVTGKLSIDALGRVLMHEHIFISNPGAEFDPAMALDRSALRSAAVEQLSRLLELGFNTFVDPCPIELGRDVELMAEISEMSGMAIICATGFYHEERGIPFYWRTSSVEQIADLLIGEIEHGIGRTGIRPGVIKAATSSQRISEVEAKFLAAASIAHMATGVPILTHTEGGLGGPEQQELFFAHSVPPHQCLIGHCCQNPDPAYQRAIAQQGSYIGFDRIGADILQSDDVRADNVVSLIGAGMIEHVILSQDRVCAIRGVRPESVVGKWIEGLRQQGQWPPPFAHLHEDFLPRLRERGVSEGQIEVMLAQNPRRYFSGDPPRTGESASSQSLTKGGDDLLMEQGT